MRIRRMSWRRRRSGLHTNSNNPTLKGGEQMPMGVTQWPPQVVAREFGRPPTRGGLPNGAGREIFHKSEVLVFGTFALI